MFNSIPSDRYVADKRFAADVYSVSQHSTKPLLYAAKVLCHLQTANNQEELFLLMYSEMSSDMMLTNSGS